jgi:hypothetical protein
MAGEEPVRGLVDDVAALAAATVEAVADAVDEGAQARGEVAAPAALTASRRFVPAAAGTIESRRGVRRAPRVRGSERATASPGEHRALGARRTPR